jgi:hypothetical protein
MHLRTCIAAAFTNEATKNNDNDSHLLICYFSGQNHGGYCEGGRKMGVTSGSQNFPLNFVQDSVFMLTVAVISSCFVIFSPYFFKKWEWKHIPTSL